MAPRIPLPTDAWLRWLLVPALAFIAQVTNDTWLADFWHHLARGRYIVEEGRLLDHDIFTFTVPATPFQDGNWLSQVIYYLLYQAGGLNLVRVVNALLVALTFAWLIALCRRLSRSLTVALGLGIVVFLGMWQVLNIRPQTFSLLLFVILYDLLERRAEGRKPPADGAASGGLRPSARLWVAPAMLALWANLHGAFPAGIMLLGCYWLEALWDFWQERGDEQRGRLVQLTLVGAASVLATLLNPYGWRIYQYVGQTSGVAAARGIDEWLPPRFDTFIGATFFVSLPVLAALFATAWKRRGERPAPRELFLLACFFVLAIGSVRMVAWWLIVIAPMAARRLTLLWPGARDAGAPQPNSGAALCCAALALLAILSLPGLQRFNPLLALRPADPTLAHVQEALTALEGEMNEGKVFTKFEWGEYLAWAAAPDFKIFMDGRIEIYPDDVWQAYATVTQGQAGWQEVLDAYAVDALLLDADYHGRSGLYGAVEQAPHWRRVHQRGDAALFVRRRD